METIMLFDIRYVRPHSVAVSACYKYLVMEELILITVIGKVTPKNSGYLWKSSIQPIASLHSGDGNFAIWIIFDS